MLQIGVVIINFPPLREGRDGYRTSRVGFLRQYATQDGKKNLSFTPEAFRAINRHRRLGNVDELQNRVKTAENMAYRGEITGNDSNLLHKLRLPLP